MIWQAACSCPTRRCRRWRRSDRLCVYDRRFEKRVVKTGMEQRGRVAVLEGVKQGEKVVTEGSFILKSEMLKGELGEE